MRVVDFYAFPDRAQLREELIQAFEDIDLDEGAHATPIDDAAPLAVGYPPEFDDETVRSYAEDLRQQLEAAVSEDLEIRFELADPDASNGEGGSPTHTE